ncbi:MAG: hypothetical protein ACLFV5_08700 [Anaerolineales bacterium]
MLPKEMDRRKFLIVTAALGAGAALAACAPPEEIPEEPGELEPPGEEEQELPGEEEQELPGEEQEQPGE